MNHGRRLSPQEIAERFGAMKREHEQKVRESRRRYERRVEAQETEAYLAKQENVSADLNLGEVLKDAYRKGFRARNAKGHFMKLPE